MLVKLDARDNRPKGITETKQRTKGFKENPDA